ncbi:MAG: ATP-binding protein [Actinobacteria bacterium]|nr:ATP-binding protein [Actinomycetota bacterium]
MTSLTQPARPPGRRLAAFAVASEPGNERLALDQVAAAVASSGLTPARLERLKTAVAEATMNAIEHGNLGQPDVPVDVEVIQDGADIIVAITDLGGEHQPAGPAEEPDLALKLDGVQRARGWGLFLIRNMVDGMQVRTDGQRHTVELTMRSEGDQT